MQTSGISTFKFLLFKSTHLFSNLAIIFLHFYSSPSWWRVYFSQKLSSLETSTTVVYYSTTTSGYYATTSGVCCKNSVKIPSYCTTPLLPLKRHQNLLLYSNWCQFSTTIFPHLPISTFSLLQIQSCWYRIRKEKIKSIFNPP